jgi:hypothetical protein
MKVSGTRTRGCSSGQALGDNGLAFLRAYDDPGASPWSSPPHSHRIAARDGTPSSASDPWAAHAARHVAGPAVIQLSPGYAIERPLPAAQGSSTLTVGQVKRQVRPDGA